MAPLIMEFEKNSRFQNVICVSAQHRQMLDQVLEIFQLTPHYDLDIMKANQDLFDVSTGVLSGLKPVLEKEKPDYVFVQGDTTTTALAALSAFYYKTSVCHIEAGLRTNNIYSPWPEEVNRQITTRIAEYHFAPTEWSKRNLELENISSDKIFITGNTGIDALLFIKSRINSEEELARSLHNEIENKGYRFSPGRRIVLVTGHRRENFGEGFQNICSALKQLAVKYRDVDFVYPVHLNPNVQSPVRKTLAGVNNVYLLPPLDYLPFVYLMMKSYLILTDSGGIQEEGPSLGKPIIVLREVTERGEAVEAGTVKLVGTDVNKIITAAEELLNNDSLYSAMARAHNPYGDGTASKKIAQILNEKENQSIPLIQTL